MTLEGVSERLCRPTLRVIGAVYSPLDVLTHERVRGTAALQSVEPQVPARRPFPRR